MASGMPSARARHSSSTSTSRARRPIRALPVPVEATLTSEQSLTKPMIEETTDENHNLTDIMDTTEVSQASSIDPISEASSRGESPDDVTTAEESIGIDYRGGPAEVVVHGKNVSKIRVKFPPQPPPFEDGGARSARRRHRSRQAQKEKVEEDNIPFSKEESIPYAHAVCHPPQPVPSIASYPVLPNVPRIDSNMYTVQSDGSGSSLFNSFGDLSNRSEGITLIPLSSTTDVDVERRMKDGILVGLEYFEKRNTELREIKNKLIHELDRVIKVNSELKGSIDNLSKRLTYAHSENDELKIKVDQTEKENMRLQDQAVAEWTSRVKAEELYVELNASSQQEITGLRTQLDTRDSELRALKLKLDTLAQHSADNNKDELFELHTKVADLKEDVRRLTAENELFKDKNNKMASELENAKRQVVDKNAELERQFNRFLSLKKSFNDIVEENERLKNVSKPQRVKASNVANVTWPREGEQPGSDVTDGETVRRLDLPPAAGAKVIRTSPVTAGGRGVKPAFTSQGRHRRQGSDARSENLPPVSKKDAGWRA